MRCRVSGRRRGQSGGHERPPHPHPHRPRISSGATSPSEEGEGKRRLSSCSGLFLPPPLQRGRSARVTRAGWGWRGASRAPPPRRHSQAYNSQRFLRSASLRSATVDMTDKAERSRVSRACPEPVEAEKNISRRPIPDPARTGGSRWCGRSSGGRCRRSPASHRTTPPPLPSARTDSRSKNTPGRLPSSPACI